MKTILKSIILLVVVISCSKTKTEPILNFPQTVYFESVTEKSKIRLFTNKKEINDANSIANYVKRNSFVSIDDYKTALANFKINFIKQDSLLLSTEINKYFYKKDGDLFTITTPYTIKLKNSNFINEVMIFPYEKTPITNSTAYDFSTKEFLIGRGNHSSFSLSLTVFKLKSKIANGISEQFASLYNEFNENAISKTTVNDTLLVQELKLNFKSK
jgi:hypothetical protein